MYAVIAVELGAHGKISSNFEDGSVKTDSGSAAIVV